MTSPMELLSLDPWSPSPPQAESARLVRFASLGCSTQGLLSLSYDSAMGTRVYKGHGYELGGTSTRFSCSALSRRLLSSSEGDAVQKPSLQISWSHDPTLLVPMHSFAVCS